MISLWRKPEEPKPQPKFRVVRKDRYFAQIYQCSTWATVAYNTIWSSESYMYHSDNSVNSIKEAIMALINYVESHGLEGKGTVEEEWYSVEELREALKELENDNT